MQSYEQSVTAIISVPFKVLMSLPVPKKSLILLYLWLWLTISKLCMSLLCWRV